VRIGQAKSIPADDPTGSRRREGSSMFTITVPRPEVTSQEVTGALEDGLGPRYKVLPGMRARRNPLRAHSPAEPDAIVVGNRVLWAQVRIVHRPGRTDINVSPGGLSLTGYLLTTFGVVRSVRRALERAPVLSRA
jgi:hypothetical protein